MDMEIKHTRELKFFKKFNNYGFENCCNTAKQISPGLEMEIRFKNCHIQGERSLFSYEDLAKPNINMENKLLLFLSLKIPNRINK